MQRNMRLIFGNHKGRFAKSMEIFSFFSTFFPSSLSFLPSSIYFSFPFLHQRVQRPDGRRRRGGCRGRWGAAAGRWRRGRVTERRKPCGGSVRFGGRDGVVGLAAASDGGGGGGSCGRSSARILQRRLRRVDPVAAAARARGSGYSPRGSWVGGSSVVSPPHGGGVPSHSLSFPSLSPLFSLAGISRGPVPALASVAVGGPGAVPSPPPDPAARGEAVAGGGGCPVVGWLFRCSCVMF